MAALDFPSSPTVNQTYTANSTTWIWDGTTWLAQNVQYAASYATINFQTTGYTLVLEDAAALVLYNSSSAGTITVPTNASVAFPVGTEIYIGQYGTGALTVAGAGGVTINSSQGRYFNKQHLYGKIVKTASDTWSLGFYGIGARADLPVYPQQSVSGTVTLDRNNGEAQRLSVTGNVTSLTINNFGVSGSMCKLVLEIWNTGAFTFAWPAGTLWAGATAPTLTSGAGGKDVVILLTMDGGTTIYGSVVGQAFA